LLSLFFFLAFLQNPEDGSSIFLRNFGISEIQGITSPHPLRLLLQMKLIRDIGIMEHWSLWFDSGHFTLQDRGMAMRVAQAVSRWLPTVAARVRDRAACGVCGGQSGTGGGFLRVLRFLLPIIPPVSPLS
jgi:hypothetical protein